MYLYLYLHFICICIWVCPTGQATSVQIDLSNHLLLSPLAWNWKFNWSNLSQFFHFWFFLLQFCLLLGWEYKYEYKTDLHLRSPSLSRDYLSFVCVAFSQLWHRCSRTYCKPNCIQACLSLHQIALWICFCFSVSLFVNSSNSISKCLCPVSAVSVTQVLNNLL